MGAIPQTPSQRSARKPYHPPTLVEFGDVVALTQKKGGNGKSQGKGKKKGWGGPSAGS